MASGNGIDLGAIYDVVLAISTELQTFKAEMGAFKAEMGAFKAEMGTFKSEVRSEFGRMAATMATKDELAALRQDLNVYHMSVVGHGILLTEIDERLRRVEDRLDRVPAAR